LEHNPISSLIHPSSEGSGCELSVEGGTGIRLWVGVVDKEALDLLVVDVRAEVEVDFESVDVGIGIDDESIGSVGVWVGLETGSSVTGPDRQSPISIPSILIQGRLNVGNFGQLYRVPVLHTKPSGGSITTGPQPGHGVTTGYSVGVPSGLVRVTHPPGEVEVSVTVSRLIPGGSDVIVDVMKGTVVPDVMDERSR